MPSSIKLPTVYPLHEKLLAHKTEANALSGFLDMLDEKRIWMVTSHEHTEGCWEDEEDGKTHCGYSEGDYSSYGVPSKADLIGMYLEIDPKELEKEKRQILEEVRRDNERRKE